MMKVEKVGKILEVNLDLEKILPPNLLINVVGEMYFGGWTNPRLEPYVYIDPPADGIYEFDFVVDAPSGPTTEPVLEVRTQYRWDAYPEDSLKGVRIYSKSNSIEEKL